MKSIKLLEENMENISNIIFERSITTRIQNLEAKKD